MSTVGEEQIIYRFRKHWFVLASNLALMAFALCMPLILMWYAYFVGVMPSIITGEIMNFATVLWILIMWSALALLWTTYYLNIWMITDRRVISLELPSLFNYQVVSWEIKNLQEIIACQDGVFQNLLHFGTLEIRTAGMNDSTEVFSGVPSPESIRAMIIEQGSNFDRLVASKKDKEQLLHTVSHEVKGYLTKNQAALAGIVEGDFGEVSEDVKTIASSALGETRRGVSTVMDILHGNAVAVNKSPCDIQAISKEETEHFREAAESKGLVYQTKFFPGDYNYTGDALKLGNIVFKNLIDNAIRYTPSGTVLVELSREPQAIRFAVSDSGVGITQDDMKKLFTDGGHGAHSVEVNPESTGFGLATSKRIIEAHGGRMWAESEGAGKGSRFVVELPL